MPASGGSGAIASQSTVPWLCQKAAWWSLAASSALALWAGPALAQSANNTTRTEVETVRFIDPHLPAVRVVRGVPQAPPPGVPKPATPQFRVTPSNSEIVSFGNGRASTVTVVRGTGFNNPAAPAAGPIQFAGLPVANPRAPVNVVRGGAGPAELGLFGPAANGELDRVAFAVDGAESGHGGNPAMWRADLGGPQGPMQVSAAAAFDVGGGDRFDLRQNRLLGRAYLALLYRRYGNWWDAVAAYNWGPGNLDQWIAQGRRSEQLPLETAVYLVRVLRDAFLTGPS
jgi:hypothetical protein